MNCKRLMTGNFLGGWVLAAILFAVTVNGCGSETRHGDGRDSDSASASQGISEREGGDSEGEHRSEREGSGEHASGGDGSTSSDGGRENREAAMSSPITPLGQPWNGVLGGLAVSMQYDAATQSVHGAVRNTLSQTLCHVQAEPHLKAGMRTVGELGPEKLGHLNSGQEATSSLAVAGEAELAGVYYDGYVVHMEVFDCGGPGPAAHAGGESGNESAGEEGSGANTLALEETYDAVRGGARLILSYDAPSNSFKGTVENTTDGILERVRIEVHLSNGTELGPTTPTDMAPGEVVSISLSATPASFTEWTTHAEVGGGDDGSESGGEHRDGGEHGSGRESGGEHGSGGERKGGG